MTTEREEAALEAAEDREPIDPDIELMVHYMENWLSSDDARKVEQRFIEDAAFAEKVAPLVEIWTAPINFRTAYETHAANAANAAEPVPPITAGGQYPIREIRRRSRETTPEDVAPYRPQRSRGQKMLAGLFTGTRATGWLAALILLFAGVPFVVYQIGVANGREEELLRFFPAPKPMPAPEGKAPLEREARSVRAGRSTFVHLHEGSRFAYIRGPLGIEQIVGLRGEAVIEVGWLDPKVVISTLAGMVELSHGTYALRSTGDPNQETLVTVGEGKATLKGGSVAPDLVLSAGEHGRLAYPSPPRRTNGGDGYPAVDLPVRTVP